MQSLRSLRQLPKHVLPLAIAVACGWLVVERLEGLDMAALKAAMTTLQPHQWLIALVATAISFLAVARYDVIAHRHFQTGVRPRDATLGGATAIALGQTLGAGAVVGSFVRWRMQPGLSLIDAARISAFVAVTFLAALAVVIAVSALILPVPHIPGWLPAVILVSACCLAFLAFFFPVLRILGGREIALPTLPAMGSLMALCLIDTVAAGIAFHALVPHGIELHLLMFLPVFLVALGLAILSGTPGGVGPFELTLLSMLPHLPHPELMAAIIAFRIVYYAIPAVIAAIALLRPLREHEKYLATQPSDLADALTTPLARAELGVLRQNGGSLVDCGHGICGIVRTGQTLTALFDPVDSHAGELATPLRRIARAQNRIICKYKITSRQAVHARREGWAVLHIADEALICTKSHDLKGASYRQLRRKLRQAEKAGISIDAPAAHDLPLTEMRRIAHAWEDAHGVARGFSMGRFEEGYVAEQKVLLACTDKGCVGFITLHRSAREWCLDLMRVLPDAPDGTMHALVNRAIELAREDDIPCLSLAAVPARPEGCHPVENTIRRKFDKHANGPGLRQFKQCFAPRWQPLFMAAPGWPQLTFAACDLIRSVRLDQPRTAPVQVPAE